MADTPWPAVDVRVTFYRDDKQPISSKVVLDRLIDLAEANHWFVSGSANTIQVDLNE